MRTSSRDFTDVTLESEDHDGPDDPHECGDPDYHDDWDCDEDEDGDGENNENDELEDVDDDEDL